MIELEFKNVDFCGGRKTGENPRNNNNNNNNIDILYSVYIPKVQQRFTT
jgi:hypothetical protein